MIKYPSVAAIFLNYEMSRLALGPTQPPIEWVLRALSPGVRQLGHEADHLPHLLARIGMTRLMPPLYHMPAWHTQGQILCVFNLVCILLKDTFSERS